MKLPSEQEWGSPVEDEALNKLRQEIEEVDRQFVTLLARRQKLVQKILQRKVKLKQPLRNLPLEQQVIDRFGTLCRDRGIEASWGEDLARFLISKSLEVQNSILKQ
jgi:chorismate mutase